MQTLENTRVVPLDNGNNLIISYNEKFYDKVRKFFKLSAETNPTDEQLKEFFVRVMSAA